MLPITEYYYSTIHYLEVSCMKLIMINSQVVPSESTETYIDLKLEFSIKQSSEYYGCFNKLTEDDTLQIKSRITKNFCYHGYLEDCNTVKGIIADLQELKDNIKPKSMLEPETRLLRCIEALISFWH